MNNDSRQRLVRAAAQNNAEWCDAFCRTHGVIGVFDSERWFSPVRTPPYYPDVVTLTPEVRIEQALAGADAGDGCSVKDSFASLDVAGAGFGELLRGQWVVREATEAEAPPGWAKIEDDDELREWEAAWGTSRTARASSAPRCSRTTRWPSLPGVAVTRSWPARSRTEART